MHSSRSTKRAIRAALLVATLLMPARAGAAGDIDVRIDSQSGGVSTHGYTEYAATLSNRSTRSGHTVTLKIPSEIDSRRANQAAFVLRSLTRTVTLGPGETTRVALFIPDRALVPGDGLLVTVDGHGPDDIFRLASNAMPSQRFAIAPLLLVSPGVRDEVMTRLNIGRRQFPNEFPQILQADSSVSVWSPNWLAYSRYDGVLVTGEDLQKAAPEIRAALIQYTEAGGVLIVRGKLENRPRAWHRTEGEPAHFEAGFGECIIDDSEDIKAWDNAPWGPLNSVLRRTASPWQNVDNDFSAAMVFPVGEFQLPVRGLLFLMILFAIVIGPVNLYVLGRLRRRIWMLWTVPALSFFTCFAVFGYMLWAEGWSGHLRTKTLTVLDESTGRATTLGRTAVYTPLTPRSGLHFSNETEVTSLVTGIVPFSRARVTDVSRTIDWTQDQHLAQGWVQPRIMSQFHVRKCDSRSERLTIRRGEIGQVFVVNGLGATIEQLMYADEKGTLFTERMIPAGADRQLFPLADTVASNKGLRTLYTGSWISAIQELENRPGDYLRKGTYFAILDGNPFFEESFPHAGNRNLKAVVYGIRKEGANEN